MPGARDVLRSHSSDSAVAAVDKIIWETHCNTINKRSRSTIFQIHFAAVRVYSYIPTNTNFHIPVKFQVVPKNTKTITKSGGASFPSFEIFFEKSIK